MEQTHVFKMTSGVEAEVKELTGKHQRLLTEKKDKGTFSDKLDQLLADRVVRIGSVKNPDVDFFKDMLDSDKAKLLVEIRQFTMEHEPSFTFTWEYKSEKTGKFTTHTHEEELPNGAFPMETLKVYNHEGELVDATYTEYDQIEKNYTFTLPKSGIKVRWTLLDGNAVRRGAATKKTELSSHTQIYLRNPVKFVQGKKNAVPMRINLDNLPYKDIEALRKEIKRVEGKVYTQITFEHPEAEYKVGQEKIVKVDVLGSQAFFYPSEAL